MRKRWSDCHDAFLIESINLFKEEGRIRWKKVSQHVPHKNAKQCNERWTNHLNPELDKSKFTKQEDEILLTCRSRNMSWSSIRDMHLPKRCTNDLKNHYNLLANKQPGFVWKRPSPLMKRKPVRHASETPVRPKQKTQELVLMFSKPTHSLYCFEHFHTPIFRYRFGDHWNSFFFQIEVKSRKKKLT